jgi:hypothetical protein
MGARGDGKSETEGAREGGRVKVGSRDGQERRAQRACGVEGEVGRGREGGGRDDKEGRSNRGREEGEEGGREGCELTAPASMR